MELRLLVFDVSDQCVIRKYAHIRIVKHDIEIIKRYKPLSFRWGSEQNPGIIPGLFFQKIHLAK